MTRPPAARPEDNRTWREILDAEGLGGLAERLQAAAEAPLRCTDEGARAAVTFAAIARYHSGHAGGGAAAAGELRRLAAAAVRLAGDVEGFVNERGVP